MMIHVHVTGGMERYVSATRFTVELADGATLGDLLPHIGQYIRHDRPQPYWNEARQTFRGPVLVLVRHRAVWVAETPLHGGETVTIKRLLMGG